MANLRLVKRLLSLVCQWGALWRRRRVGGGGAHCHYHGETLSPPALSSPPSYSCRERLCSALGRAAEHPHEKVRGCWEVPLGTPSVASISSVRFPPAGRCPPTATRTASRYCGADGRERCALIASFSRGRTLYAVHKSLIDIISPCRCPLHPRPRLPRERKRIKMEAAGSPLLRGDRPSP